MRAETLRDTTSTGLEVGKKISTIWRKDAKAMISSCRQREFASGHQQDVCGNDKAAIDVYCDGIDYSEIEIDLRKNNDAKQENVVDERHDQSQRKLFPLY